MLYNQIPLIAQLILLFLHFIRKIKSLYFFLGYVKIGSEVVSEMFRCFLLTPKLLSDLEYSEACSVLNVMNGPWIEQPSKGYIFLPKLL